MNEVELRLECLKWATATHPQGSGDKCIIATAQAMYEFITGKSQPHEAKKAA